MDENTNTPDFITEQLKQYNVADAEIAKLGERFLPMKINGLEDTDGYDAVKTAALDMRTLRTTVEKKRVELKADALKFGRAIDGEAKRIQELIAPIESHLVTERTAIDEEKAAKELAEKLQGLLPMRLEKLATIELTVPEEELNKMDEANFFVFFNEKQAEYLARKEEERAAAAQQLEDERQALAKEKEELAKEKERVEEIGSVKEETIQETRQAVAEEQKEEEKQATSAAAQAPEKEKLAAFVKQLDDLHWPRMDTNAGTKIMADAMGLIAKVKTHVNNKAEKL